MIITENVLLTISVAALTALPPTLMALATWRQGRTIIEKTIEIHTSTNSNLAALTKTLEVAQEKISGLENMIAELNKQKE